MESIIVNPNDISKLIKVVYETELENTRSYNPTTGEYNTIAVKGVQIEYINDIYYDDLCSNFVEKVEMAIRELIF
jgi:hypothetical protein